MPIDGLKPEQIQEFLDRNVLHSTITIPVIATQQHAESEGEPPTLTGPEQRVYERVIYDLEQIALLLEGVSGTSIDRCPVDTSQQGGRGYILTRKVLYDHNVLEITRASRPDFYWRVGIRDSGDPDHEITGFYHGCSSGNFSDIRDAVDNTKHLFPAIGCKLRTGAIARARPQMSG